MTPKENTEQQSVGLSRNLGLFDITMIGVGAMIGAGIFILTGLAAGAAGPALILVFALNGIVTIFTAMVYAELGSAIPEAGGGYLWVKEGLARGQAFYAGWMSWFAHSVAGSLYAAGFGSFLNEAFKMIGFHPGSAIPTIVITRGIGVCIVLVFLYINFRGASETGMASNIITLLKVVIILFFIGCGLYTMWQHPNYMEKFSDFTPEGLGGIAVAMGLTFVAFEGYEIIVQAGEEVRNPRRNLPKAVFLSLLIVVPIYMAVAFVFIGAVHVPPGTNLAVYQWLGKLGELGLIQAGAQFVPLGKYLLLLAALLSTMSALNATTFSSSRVAFAMGRDRNLPDRFGQVHSSRKTPHWALMFSGIIMIMVLVSLPVKDVASAADIMFLLLFLQVNVAVISIRKQFGDKLGYGYLIPFFPWIPIAGIVSKLFLAIWLFTYSAVAWYYALGWLAIGGVLYFTYASKRERKAEIAPVISEWRTLPKSDVFRVLVPVANPETAKQLIRYGAQFVQPRTGELLVLHVVSVPDQTPLSFGRNFVSESNMVLEEAVTEAKDLDMSVSRLIRIAHNPADAIVSTIKEYNVNFSIMGWRGSPEDQHTVIGRDIDQISRVANTNLIILEKSLPTEVKSVLVPLANANQAAFAVQVAGMLFPNAPSEEPLLTLLHVNTEQAAGEAMVQRIRNALTEFEKNEHPLEWPGRWEVKLKVAPKTMSVILNATDEYDAMLLETSQGLLHHPHFSGRTFKTLARGAQCPVILLKLKESPVKFGFRRIIRYLRELVS